jgi:hypothetical protein
MDIPGTTRRSDGALMMTRRLAMVGTLATLGLMFGSGILHAATCTGDSPCNACKNCKYCKRCAKNGGTCGACRKRRN